MRVPVAWLREYCDPQVGTAELADRLNLAGVEVGRVDRAGVPDVSSFVVGKVLSAERHPDADRLTVCQVDDGSGDARTIVCGAPNVAPGQTVAVALPGATMPGGDVLGEAKLRGVVSSGMILAEDEVGIGEDHAGIMVLPETLAAGAPLAEHLAIADDVLDLEIAPNRPDCLAIYGVAREVHAITEAPLAEDPADADADAEPGDHGVSVDIEDPEVCLRFTARVFEDVTIAPSPLWLKARLGAAGQRPISNVVDITNYVMLVTGQPLHAFDLDKVRGGRIVVRRARQGETMATLDGIERELSSETALVCDAEGPSGVAGIMGGQVSEVSASTTRVLMEAATWVGTNILRSSARLGLRTEASARFEKQIHPELAMAGQRLAARLMVELCGARLVGETVDAYPEPVEPPTIALRPKRVAKLLGTEVPDDDIQAILERLGFQVSGGGDSVDVTVPPWRWSDVQREVDLVEEVGRIFGLDRMPATLPARRRAIGRLSPSQLLRRRLEDALRDRGLFEAVSYSFTSPGTLERLRLVPDAVRLANPLSEEQSVMRPLLLPGLLDAARHNAAHGRPGVRLFESAHVYTSPERHHLAALLTGFYPVKAILEALLDAVAVAARFERGQQPFLHPGRCASVVSHHGRELGWIGDLHPAVAADWDLAGEAAFEIDVDLLAELAPEAIPYRDIGRFPPALIDLAIAVPEEVPYSELEGLIRSAGGSVVENVELFDLYRGEQLPESFKSLAFRLRLRSPERTLTDEDLSVVRERLEAEVSGLGGFIRDN